MAWAGGISHKNFSELHENLSDILDSLMGLAGFADSSVGQKAREDNQMIKDSIMIVSNEFPLKLADGTELTPFLIFKSMNRGIYGPGITWSLKSINADPQMEVYIVNNGGEECMLGLLSLNKEYPFTCIFRETLKEKINGWFVKQDVDFEEYKKFSDQFHMVSGDPSEIRSFLWNKPLDELTAFPAMEAEINRRHCLFRNSPKPVSREEAQSFTLLAKKLMKILS